MFVDGRNGPATASTFMHMIISLTIVKGQITNFEYLLYKQLSQNLLVGFLYLVNFIEFLELWKSKDR